MTGIPYDWLEGLLVLLGASVLLVLVVVISVIKNMGIAREMLLAVLKGGGQLLAIALFLTFLFGFDQWYFLIWLLLGTMVAVSGHTAARRAADMPGAFQVTTPAILAGAAAALVVLAFSRAMPLHPQFIVPLAGMAFGNSMKICSLSLERLMREVRANRTAIETALSLGATSRQALEEYGKISVKASLIPTIDSLKTLGIIFIPGAMAGLLIAGTDPLVAAEYQIIVYLMIVGGGIISSLLASTLSRPKLFTAAEQLQPWV
ncbi:MAG: iron export ABC transporter permease subunit FetB [Candidatus Thermoplasmatota archaeon]|nr:iron export ABC transporter permease subunit FetB [Candidatus Thermoplasmatota archaeon]MDD5777857.1 iron export ABC transporter permease subunit FetB [Candidatus Thermoplasmatota archaeon]